jgi:uncharacterized membrane-anchored protein
MIRSLLLALPVLVVPASALRAQDAPPPGEQAPGTEVPQTAAEWYAMLIEKLKAEPGPVTGSLGPHAELQVPEGRYYVNAQGAQRLLTATGNIPSRSELGAVLSPPAGEKTNDWFVIFTFDDCGYVEDKEKDDLDADDLLDSIRDNVKEGNEERKHRGLDTLEVAGWEKPPFYDTKTNNLTWGLRIRNSSGGESINWEVRLLGRKGVMNAQLVVAPEDLQASLPGFDQMLAGFAYKDGQRYAQYVEGDHVAEYGLGALVLGGAGVAAAKLGFFAKFWKLILGAWKLILVGLAAVGGAAKKMWGKVAGERKQYESHKSG